VDTAVIEGLIENATAVLKDVAAEGKDDADKRLADTKALLDLI
jgi:hypothetical protein